MPANRTISTVTPGSGFPRVALGVGWALAALPAGALGWLLFAMSDRPDGRAAGGVLLGVFLLGALTAAVLFFGYRARSLSLVTSAVFVLSGAAMAVVLAAESKIFTSDLLLLGGIPVAGGVATGLLAFRRVTAAPPP